MATQGGQNVPKVVVVERKQERVPVATLLLHMEEPTVLGHRLKHKLATQRHVDQVKLINENIIM